MYAGIKMLKMLYVLMILLWTPESLQTLVTVQGRLQGEVHDGYVSYNGIPYATVSSDGGRFKRASLAPSWHGVRESHEPHCSATSSVEECLKLDVHTPSSGSGAWPVLVWVTGGSGRYNPRKLVHKDIIVVIVHHRQGPLGFLCLGDERIPGNAGVKDVVLALRWVQDNVVAFRGNPARVVIAGQGYGAAMVEALMVSPMASGLYHGAILQSGSVLCPWAFNYDSTERAKHLARMFTDTDDMTAVLLNAKTDELVAKSDKLDIPYFPFGMCVEKSLKNEERLLSEAPFELLSNKKLDPVPVMIGYNSDEAYIFSSILKESNVMQRLLNDVSYLVPDELKFLNERELKQCSRKIEDMYFKINRTMAAVMAYHRDAYFVNHIHRSVRLHASASPFPVYFYQFSHTGDAGVQSEPGVKKTGAAHSDELAYLWSGRDLEGEDEMVQRHLIKLWTNFVKFFNPTHKESTHWDPVSLDNLRLLDITTEPKMTNFPHARAAHTWDDIYHAYYYARSGVTGNN